MSEETTTNEIAPRAQEGLHGRSKIISDSDMSLDTKPVFDVAEEYVREERLMNAPKDDSSLNADTVTERVGETYDDVWPRLDDKFFGGSIELIAEYRTRKKEVESSYQEYIGNHPELKLILADYLHLVIQRKPDDVYAFTTAYFKPN